MKIHEFQARDLFREYGIPVPPHAVAHAPEEAVRAAETFGYPVALKAQVHSGGRGKAGGVAIVRNAEQTETEAARIFGLVIKGFPVRTLIVTPASSIAQEAYLSVLVDRSARKAVFIGCNEGGVEIEVTARQTPEKIARLEIPVRRLAALTPEDCLSFASCLFADPAHAAQAAAIVAKMGSLFVEKDCSLVEINPLIADADGRVVALDAKVAFDDNALFRHPESLSLRDMESEDGDELEAKGEGLSFIRLTGSIACMVNGAGLAMATMDTIKHVGGDPANFLDVGGSSNPHKVVAAFRMILRDPNVKVILINIFGGITRCDDIARGILSSLENFPASVPIVIRLVGTNQEEGRRLLEGTRLSFAKTLEEGAALATKLGGAA
ncbi:MAG TPA: ADP-forming succinate--CoA ligase subunit beta [Candidatus Hydrogenedentes bacterium]|mgnify:CR=1 FL=1|nr:ADP-forming succinate--CoA ligase subunit beta [Candidatus Hydrogenedentota bacterium]HOS01971.1 ADP-forming succinate--CoA ligase subunit beta [Candidatus Hydrogenedentota bacterium]